MNGTKRIDDIKRLYELLDRLMCTQPRRLLSECSGNNVPKSGGVYFFYEDGEYRSDSGNGYRIVRVGLTKNFRRRLREHKGNKSGGGNHRNSVFRKLVGHTLLAKNKQKCNSWGVGRPKSRDIPPAEPPIEKSVTEILGQMWILRLPIENEATCDCIERNVTALLSNYCRCPTDCQCPTDCWCPTNCECPIDCQCPTDCRCPTNCECPIDPPSKSWLGHHCTPKKVRRSGLWSQKDVEDIYDPRFLCTLKKLILNPQGTT